MQLVFYLGIKGLFGVPLPIFVELQSLVGTVRIRLQMTPEPPFLKNLTFTLMGTPQVSAGCIPMVEKGVNILNLPLISNFVNYAIAAASRYVLLPVDSVLIVLVLCSSMELLYLRATSNLSFSNLCLNLSYLMMIHFPCLIGIKKDYLEALSCSFDYI